MSSQSLLDPQIALFLTQFPNSEINAETLAAVRARTHEMWKTDALAPPAAATVDETERRVPGPAGAPDVRVLVYRPKGATGGLPAFLHIHGGGYVMGLPEMTAQRNRGLATDVNCIVVSVDYRLAPETRYPGPLEDCYAALKWLHTSAAQLGIDPRRIAVGGESAGGGLAAALALLARDRGEIPLAFQLLIYPMIDDRTCISRDPHPFAGQFIWTPPSNRFGWEALLGCEPGGTELSPYAAAARAERLAGLPPTFISTGSLDLFMEEDVEYARKLTRAGVPTELHVYPGAPHGFDMVPDADVTKNFNRDYRTALRKALNERSLVT